MPALRPPALFSFSESRHGSVIEWSVEAGCRLSCKLTEAETHILLVLVEAWRTDRGSVGPNARPELAHGFRSSVEIGKAYAERTGRGAPVVESTVRKALWKMQRRMTGAAVEWGTLTGHSVNAPTLFEQDPAWGRRLATSDLQVTYQRPPDTHSAAGS